MRKLLFYCTVMTFSVLLSSYSLFGASYRGFKEVRDNKCVVLEEKDINRLPPPWHSYKGFIKICNLKKDKTSEAKISIISVWSHDYLDGRKKTNWEDFPLPILVDDRFNTCGTFPELYPSSYVNSLYVYYGKWNAGIPTEIRIDVADPTVSGDYYYAPLLWDNKSRTYRMKSTKPKTGKRPN
jgi:hypothetical protein